MIVHIVMFKFNAENKTQNILQTKQLLENLSDSIEVLRSLEVGINFDEADRAFDLCLTTTFKTKEDLQTYATHKEHLKVLKFIKQVTLKSHVVDYEK